MKRIITSLFTLLLCAVGFAQSVGMSAFGYGNTKGGQGGEIITVSSASELASAVNKKKNRIVIITNSITYNSQASFQGLENVTILGMPGVTLTNTKQNKDDSGIWNVKDSKNVIIRNLTFIGPGAYDCDGKDLLCFDGVTNAWVDHCDFQDGCDGNFDNKAGTDNVTVSWCRFRYLKDPKAGGSGGSDDHRYTNLIGSDSSDKPSDKTYNMTWAYCWWDEGCVERMTRARNASLHFLNCYWNSSVAKCYLGLENVDAYVEGCTFAGGSSNTDIYKSYGGKNGVQYVNSVSTVKGQTSLSNISDRTVVDPSNVYTYTALTAAESKTAITNATCGAGATLVVKTDGTVSSACDDSPSGGEENPDTDQPGNGGDSGTGDDTVVENSTWWNFSDADFASLGTISATTTVRGLTIAATSEAAVTVDANNKSADGYDFTSRCKLGGAGSKDARHFKFTVTGKCTLKLYVLSANTSETRTVNIAQGTFDNVITTLTAPTSGLAASVYEYTSGAGDIYIYSASGGVNFYGIQVIYPSEETPDPDQPDTGGDSGDTDTSDPEVEGACYSFRPTITSGDLKVGDVVETSVGGTMKVAGMKKEGSISYDILGLKLSGGGADSISVWLDNNLTVGSVITVTMTYSENTTARGVNLLNAQKKVVMAMKQVTDGNDYSFSYTVEANDGLANTRYFCLQRQNSTYIKQITVTCNEETNIPTNIDKTQSDKEASKFIHEGRLYIRTADGVVYDITGYRVNITK